ncbi:hypothetical protein [Microcoleus sp. herbarium12]|uniref:hypothetical protein n=1 Tax=Microcoleus sp. herbarium12 TaxID=3055437 RepID=UPI002FD12B74
MQSESIWCECRSIFFYLSDRTPYNDRSVWYLVLWAIALFYSSDRTPYNHRWELDKCDRSFILGDRSSETTKGSRS